MKRSFHSCASRYVRPRRQSAARRSMVSLGARLVRVEHVGHVEGDFANVISQYDYTYDAAGRRMARTENGETTTYTLGAGDRLASWTGGSYAYNTAGCVTRIERDGRSTLDLTWNGQYQLVSISTNGVFAEGYAYDAMGRRVSTTTLEGAVRHVYDDSWQCLADIDENGNVICSYVWGEGIDKLLAVKIGGESYYPLIDIQGTVWGYADSANNVAARWTYDVWGNVLSEFCTVSSLASVRYRFQGREWSHATCLMNFRMRWYDSNTGRWLSKDPIRLNGGLNLYAFCGGVPNVHRDPQGLVCLIPPTIFNMPLASPENIRRSVLENAQRHIGSQEWLYCRGVFLWRNKHKCNKFVADMYNSTWPLIPMGLFGSKPPTARDWYAGRIPRGFRRVFESKPGDIASDGVHMGIVSKIGTTISASSHLNGVIVEDDWGFRTGTKSGNAATIRFYTYEGVLHASESR